VNSLSVDEESHGRQRRLRTRVKICGITSAEDAKAAVDYGADAIGVILVAGSPRYMGDRMDAVEAICSAVPPFVTRVAVVRNAQESTIIPLGLFDAVQFYDGTMPASGPRALRYIHAVHGEEAAHAAGCGGAAAVLFDAHDPERLGGTGVTADWAAARAVVEALKVPVVLAGGLTPENVADAIRTVRPYAVDTASGVEHAPGVKDEARMRRFLEAVRAADAMLLSSACEVAQ